MYRGCQEKSSKSRDYAQLPNVQGSSTRFDVASSYFRRRLARCRGSRLSLVFSRRRWSPPWIRDRDDGSSRTAHVAARIEVDGAARLDW